MTELAQTKTVKVGGNERRLPPFRSYKIAVALDIIGAASDEFREMLSNVAEARREYAAANPVRYTRPQIIEWAAENQQMAEQVTREASTETDPEKLLGLEQTANTFQSRAAMWESQLADMGDKDYFEAPGSMPQEEEIFTILPLALKMRKQLVQLIGLAITPDEQLQDSWVNDNVLEVIETMGRDVLFEMEAGEEVEFLMTAREMFEAQLRPRKWALDALRGLWEKARGIKPAEPDKEAKTDESESQQEPEDDSSPISSTSSPSDTDGPQSESSLASSTT